MRALGLLVAKDLRLLLRSPLMVAALVGYPVLVALLVATALQGQQRPPAVGVVMLDAPGRTVQVGDRRLSVDDYVARLAEEVRVSRMSPEQAERALRDGRVTAVLTIPEGFIGDLQSGVRQPTLLLRTSRSSPVEGTAVQRRLEAAVYRFNQDLAQGYVAQVVRLVDFISDGGDIGVFGRRGRLIGLTRSRELVLQTQARLRARGESALAARMTTLLEFIDETQRNLDLARPAATAISSPIKVRVDRGDHGREALSGYGAAGALLVSVALVGVLLGASGVAAEREELTLTRLRRGLVGMPALVVQKVVVSAIACLAVGMVLLAAVALLSDLAVGRWALWPGVLLVAGAACGAFGALVGAVARETRAALLAALMLALPLVFAAFVPGGAADAVAGVTPFGPAFRVFRALLADPVVPSLWTALARLVAVGVVLGAAAALVLRGEARPPVRAGRRTGTAA